MGNFIELISKTLKGWCYSNDASKVDKINIKNAVKIRFVQLSDVWIAEPILF
jgi:hypothetical protein